MDSIHRAGSVLWLVFWTFALFCLMFFSLLWTFTVLILHVFHLLFFHFLATLTSCDFILASAIHLLRVERAKTQLECTQAGNFTSGSVSWSLSVSSASLLALLTSVDRLRLAIRSFWEFYEMSSALLSTEKKEKNDCYLHCQTPTCHLSAKRIKILALCALCV